MHSTPPEISIKIEAWNDARRREKLRDYEAVKLSVWAYNSPKDFPSFAHFYPEKVAPPPKELPAVTDQDAKRDIAMMVP